MSAPVDRNDLVRRFGEFLDRTLESEEPPRGVDAEILAAVENPEAEKGEQHYDSYSLWSAVTALTQEVKLEGRAFKELKDALGAQTGRIGDELRAVYRDRERDLQKETERRTRREILGALVDLRDRLMRGLDSARASEIPAAPQLGWYGRLGVKLGLLSQPPAGSSETVAALLRGYELAVERLDQTLREFDAREIRCQGQPFDPRRMNAIDTEESSDAADGTVLEVYRAGYEWNGEVFRPAQVKVARARAVQHHD